MKRYIPNTHAALTSVAYGGSGRGVGKHPQIVGEQAQPDSAVHASVAVVATAVELMPSFEPIDPALDARPPVPLGVKPCLSLMCLPFGRPLSRLRQDDLRHLTLCQLPLVCGRLQALVARHQVGRMLEALDVGVDARHDLCGLVEITGEHLIVSDDAALDLRQPDHPPKHDRLAGLAFAQYRRTRREQTDDFLHGGHRFVLQYPARGLLEELLQPLQQFLQTFRPALDGGIGRGRHGCQCLTGLGHHRFGQLHQVAVGRLQGIGGLFTFLTVHIHNSFHAGLCRRCRLLQVGHTPVDRVLSHLLDATQQARHHPHPIVKQSVVARMMGMGFHHRPVKPQLTPIRFVQLPCQVGHVIRQGLHSGRLNQPGPADQGRVVRHPLRIHATELAQHQAVCNELFGLLVTPAIQMFDHQHAQHDLHGGRGTPIGAHARIPLNQIGFHGLEDRVMVEQTIQLCQHRIHLYVQLRNRGKQIDRVIPVAQHFGPPPSAGATIRAQRVPQTDFRTTI